MKKLFYFLTIVLLVISCKENGIDVNPPPPPNETVFVSKKGAAFSNRAKDWSHKTSALKVHWMYSWGNVVREEIPDNVEFVPMFWGKSSVTDENINRIKGLVEEGKVKYILGFNEPDGVTQANMTVDEAVELWPRLEEIGVPIGSPATVNPDNEWMVEFMERAETESLRVDFIAVHHYAGLSVTNLINKLTTAHRNFGERPIWITEFAVADWNATSQANNRYSVAEIEDFMSQVLPALDDIEWIERYAWFSGTNPPLVNSSLFDDDSQITSIGQLYASQSPNTTIGTGVDTDFEPEVDPDELVQNPGFETGLIAPWGGFKNGVVGVSDAFTPFEGNFSSRIENGDGSLNQVIAVEVGTTYRVSFQSRWRDEVSQNIFATIRNNADNEKMFDLPQVPFTTEWTESIYEFTVPDGITEIKIQWYKPNGFPPLYIDNVSIKVKEE